MGASDRLNATNQVQEQEPPQSRPAAAQLPADRTSSRALAAVNGLQENRGSKSPALPQRQRQPFSALLVPNTHSGFPGYAFSPRNIRAKPRCTLKP